MLYVFIWHCPSKLPFFIKNVPLNMTICYIYLFELILFANTLTNVQQTVLCPTIFFPYEWVSVFYYNLRTRRAYPSGISSCRHNLKLNLVPVIPHVKELQLVSLTSSRGWCINYRPKANFYWPSQQLTTMSLFNLFLSRKQIFRRLESISQIREMKKHF